jgi:D-arginine dehydrogenase
MNHFDVLVIGAGIAGASVAYRLAEHRSVLLLEREAQPGYHTTGRSAAMFMESYGPPGVRALTRASRAFYEQPPAGFCDTPLLSPRGVLYLAEPGQGALLAALHQAFAAQGDTMLPWSAAQALDCVPVLRPERVAAALWDAASADIDVHTLHQGFLRGLRQRGGSLRTSAQPTEAKPCATGRGFEVVLADGELLRADCVVNAAGAWADELAALFGAAPIGLEPKRRSAFTFTAPAGVDPSRWPLVGGVDESYYFKPDAGRLLGSPANADPTVPHDVAPEELDIAIGISRIEAVSTLQIRRPSSTWAGLRSFVADGELVIGWDAACPSFFWLAGQGGYGIQSAAAASELAASMVLEQAMPEALLRHGVDASVMSVQRLR